MSISSSMYTCMSSLFCLGTKIEVLADNLANIDTTGFRTTSLSFEDVLSQATSTGGVRLSPEGPTSDFSKQGSTEPTDTGTNMAISGDGFFILRDKDDASVTYYTRAGEFDFDSEGYLVNPWGHIVQGYAFNDQGTEGTTLADIQLELTAPDPTPEDPDPAPRLFSSPSASTKLTLISNIDARTLDHSTGPGGLFDDWDATNAVPISSDCYELRAAHQIYDSSGDRQSIEVYYDRTPQASTWEYLITSPPQGAGAAPKDGVLARGTITFDNYGYINAMTIENYQGAGWTAGTPNDDGYLAFQTPFAGAGTVEFDIGVTYVDGNWVRDALTTTQFGCESYTTYSNTDGYGEGDLIDFSVTTDGIIRAGFDNGVISDLFRVRLANSTDPSNLLRRVGSTLYQADTSASGELITGAPGSSGFGIIVGNSLEKSNVDLARQFGELIFAQRALQANAKGIVAADEILKTLIGLKRY